MPESVIECSGLSRSYGSIKAVSNLDLQVEQGCIYGFLGPNGAGKTTTIRMILGLLKPDAGDVRLWGGSLSLHRRELLGKIGALVETPSLYPHLTGRENLEITRRLSGAPSEAVGRALAATGMTGGAGRKVKNYSHGMRQRLGLALALVNEPRLLILDEPSNGLDPAGIREFRSLLQKLSGDLGITVFLSSHILSEVEQIASHIGIIQAGRLRFQGRVKEMKSRLGIFLRIEVDFPLKARGILESWGRKVHTLPGRFLRIEIDGDAEVPDINARLVEQGIRISHLSMEKSSLEEAFFSLTGDEVKRENMS